MRQRGTSAGRLGRHIRRLPHRVQLLASEEFAYGHASLFVPVMIGAGAVVWFAAPRDPAFWIVLFVAAVAGMVALITRHRHGPAGSMAVAVLLFAAGMVLAQMETWRHATVVLDTAVTTQLTGVVERREADAQGRWRYLVRVEQTTAPVLARAPDRVTLLARGKQSAFQSGDRISGKVRISPPSGPALPGLHDFAFSSYFDGIGAVGFFYGQPTLEEPGAPSQHWAAATETYLFSLRSTIGTRIRQTVAGDAGAFAAAIVTDERRAISPETIEALRLSGLAHIVAISGLNMALAAGIFFVGVRTALSLFPGFSQAYPIKKFAAFGALLMATAYYLISGFGVSAERAYIMMAVMLTAVLFDRASISLRNVALSALIIIVVSPSEILGPSFQMSFAATAALVAGFALWTQRSARRDPQQHAWPQLVSQPVAVSIRFLSGIVATSLIGSISTTMFSVEHFHRIATYGLAANLAAMPIISFIVMPAGLIGMLLMPFGLDGPFLTTMGWGLALVIRIAEYVADWGGDVAIGRQHTWFLPLAASGFVLLTLLRTRLRLVGLPLLVAAIVLSWNERSRPPADLLISEDGSMVALAGGATVITNRTRPPTFIYDQWKRALLIDDPKAPTMSPPESSLYGKQNERRDLTHQEIENARSAIRTAQTAQFICVTKAWCAARSAQGAIIVAVEDTRFAGAACDAATVVIAPKARLVRCRSGALLLNGAMLRKTGALEIDLNSSAEKRLWTIHAAMADGDRPWTRHRQYDWRSRTFDPTLPDEIRALIR